jgi:hypothetical protein
LNADCLFARHNGPRVLRLPVRGSSPESSPTRSPEGSPTSVSQSALRCSWSAGPPIPPCDAARGSAPKSRVFQRDTVHKEGAALVRLDSDLLLTVRGSDRALDHNGILMLAGDQYTRRQVTRVWRLAHCAAESERFCWALD